MGYAHWLGSQVFDLARANKGWMGWNLILAFIPSVLAVFLFVLPHRRSGFWWVGVCVFGLFLPNAPYVLTDLIHLRWNAAQAASDSVLVFGVLPMYAAFVTLGMGSYLFCMDQIVREVHSVRPSTARWHVELPVHLLCSFGIVLGRVARLNSWDTITAPRGTAETVFATLSWRGAPFAFVAIFVAVFFAYTVLRILVMAIGNWSRRWTQRFRVGASEPTRI